MRKSGQVILPILILLCGTAAADTRTDYLIKMLAEGGNYRVRVQAATTLGKLRRTEALPALERALGDEHELVVISAVAAFADIRDTSALPILKKFLRKTRSDSVKSQVRATIRILKELEGGAPSPNKTKVKPRFLIHVDSMGNSSGVEYDGLLEKFRSIVAARVNQEVDVVIQPSGWSNKAIKKRLRKEKLKGYALSGSLIKLQKQGNRVDIKIGLNVLTNPDYSLLMMPTVGGTISVSKVDSEQVAYDKAIEGVVDKLVKMVFTKLREM